MRNRGVGPIGRRESSRYTDGVVVACEHWEGLDAATATHFYKTVGTKPEDYKVTMPAGMAT